MDRLDEAVALLRDDVFVVLVVLFLSLLPLLEVVHVLHLLPRMPVIQHEVIGLTLSVVDDAARIVLKRV